jgi:hypothetical protein
VSQFVLLSTLFGPLSLTAFSTSLPATCCCRGGFELVRSTRMMMLFVFVVNQICVHNIFKHHVAVEKASEFERA